MADFWFAECVPCGWQEKFLTEDEAIEAAENHHIREHMKGNPKKKEPITVHVQNRTDISSAASEPQPEAAAQAPPETPALPSGDSSLPPPPADPGTGA